MIRAGSELSAVERFAEVAALGIEAFGIAVIILGSGIAMIVYFWAMAHRADVAETYQALRRNLGRAILLGLEFLVAADIIATVTTDASFQNVGVLAAIVLIRTFLSFSLEMEISGRWPWQRREDQGHLEG